MRHWVKQESPQKKRRAVAWATIVQAASFAPSNTTGTTPSTLITFSRIFPLIFFFRIRARLRDATPGYDMTSSFFLRCLYEQQDGHPDFPEVGFLKGPLLLRVS